MSYLRPVIAAAITLLAWVSSASAQTAYNRLCDPAYENCRTPLIELIRNETVGIDVGFWFMEDTRYANELILKHQAGVPVRVTFDSQAYTQYQYPGTEIPVQMMRDAGIPMRDKTGTGGIFHFKTMIFVGQQVVQFSGANYSDEAFVPQVPYSNYVDEIIMFSDESNIVNSFQRRYDDIWTNTTEFSNYANIAAPLVRNYPTYPIDPELNFVPWNNFRSRSVQRYNTETVGIDSIMYRITDQAHTNALLAAIGRGVPVRLIAEPAEYRNPGKLWNAWNIDRMYMGGVAVRQRYHAGQSHEKLTILRGQAMAVLGSSNWTSASAEGQHEHNIFTLKPWIYLQASDHFDRKWYNTGPAQESEPFVPLPPDTPVQKLPLDSAQNTAQALTLKWWAGPWAHKYDVFIGTSPTEMLKVADDVELGPSQSNGDHKSYTVTGLDSATTYYWRVVGRTMANLSRASATWSFRTAGGTPPAAGGDDVVLWAWRASSASGWSVVNDATGAGGKRLSNFNAGAPKLNTALENPTQFFEMAFTASAGIPYRLWIRGKATSNSYVNDSVFVQFSDSVTSGGAATYRIGTTSATVVMIEDCSGCALMNWGWNDNAYGVGVLGPLVYFESTGVHTIRVQMREDGLSIDQIVLSPDTFVDTAPGQTLADSTIYAEQGGATLAPNAPPAVSLTTPADGSSFTAPASVTVSADASDSDGSVVRVDFFANGNLVGSDTSEPFSTVWAANGPNTYSVTAKAIDNRGAQTTSAAHTVTINPGALAPGEEIVRWAASAATAAVDWNVTADATAAGGSRLQNPNANAPKISTPAASPTQYFELAFDALAGRPYRLWIRGKAISNSYLNDSVFVQFSGSVTSAGAPTYRIGTTSATTVMIEDGTNATISGWGWADNGYGAGVLGPVIYFEIDGPQTIRIQTREDGLGIDQVVLSSVYYTTSSPGAINNDNTVLEQTADAEQGGSTPAPNAPPTVSLTGPANGSSFTAPASVTVSADAADSDGSVVRVDFFANGMLVGSDTSEPFSIAWSANEPNTYSVTAKAIDNSGGQTTSAARTVTITPGSLAPGEEVVRWASAATFATGWNPTVDATAAGGQRLQNPNAGAPKVTTPSATPAQYFELTFDALAGRPYRLWIRGKAVSNSYANDSVFVQFSGSVTSAGAPTYRIGTTSATTVMIEDGTHATISGWGWADNGYGVGVLGPTVYFETSGPQTLRIQTREDGLGIDQVVLSSVSYTTSSPGAINNDDTILAQTP